MRQLTIIILLFGLLACGQQTGRQPQTVTNTNNSLDTVQKSFQTDTSKYRTHWTTLDFLNKDTFLTEKNISGLCFIVLSDTFYTYDKPIIVKDKDKTEVLKIELGDSLWTTFKGKKYSRYDSNPFNPWLSSNNPDYFNLAFECTDTSGTYYKVWLTDKDFAFINKHNPDFKKQSIIEFVKQWTEMGFDFNRQTNPLRESATDNSSIIKHPDQDKYKIWQGESLEIKNDWIKVKTVANEIGWIKWRTGKKVLIRMYFAC